MPTRPRPVTTFRTTSCVSCGCATPEVLVGRSTVPNLFYTGPKNG
jgi:hypothetical protein